MVPALVGLQASERDLTVPSEAVRYQDPATEFNVTRLTSPEHTSLLPSYLGRALSRRGNFLLYSNDRGGSLQPYRMDLKTGQSRQLSEAKLLAPSSLTLLPDEKSCCFLAGDVVWQVNLSNFRAREVYRVPAGAQASGFCVNDDGQFAVLVEMLGSKFRLRLLSLAKGTASTVLESDEEITDPVPRPRRAGILFCLANLELHVVSFDKVQNQRLRTAPGRLGPALWSQDGRSVFYLNYPDNTSQLHAIREYVADSNEDRLVAPTSQYVHFGRNSDASVFVGASGSKASPYLLLLVRSVKRELTLCEHKASDPRLTAPIFSPNSQRVFFQTDRHGKLAIYFMSVERLVEVTE